MGLFARCAADLPALHADSGEAAVFTPSTGSAIPCFVYIDFNVALQPASLEAQVWEQGTVIELLFSDLGREPNRGETFTVDSVVYKVKAVIENDGLTVKVEVT